MCFSIRRWIEGCEAPGQQSLLSRRRGVSVSADGSKGVKPDADERDLTEEECFSIRRWIEGCEAGGQPKSRCAENNVSVSADGSKGVKPPLHTFDRLNLLSFQYPQMDRRV